MTFGTKGIKFPYIALGSSHVKAKYFLEAAATSTFYQRRWISPRTPPHILMDTMSTILTQVSGQTTVMVSLDTNALIAARQGAAWKISGWLENIAIHHTKGCACCHEYINHLLGAQSLGVRYRISYC